MAIKRVSFPVRSCLRDGKLRQSARGPPGHNSITLRTERELRKRTERLLRERELRKRTERKT